MEEEDEEEEDEEEDEDPTFRLCSLGWLRFESCETRILRKRHLRCIAGM